MAYRIRMAIEEDGKTVHLVGVSVPDGMALNTDAIWLCADFLASKLDPEWDNNFSRRCNIARCDCSERPVPVDGDPAEPLLSRVIR